MTDQLAHIRDVHRAFEMLELLVDPTMKLDELKLHLDRGELGSMLRALNAVMSSRLDMADEVLDAVMGTGR